MIKIKRQKITWIFEDKRIIAFDRLQATSYSVVNGNSKKDINELKKELSQTNIGNNWIEVLGLAQKYNLIGSAVRKEKRWLDDSDVLF